MTRERIAASGEYSEIECAYDKKRINAVQAVISLFIIVLYTGIYIINVNAANVIAAFFDSFFLLELFVLAVGIVVFVLIALFFKSIAVVLISENRLNSLKFKFLSEVQKPYCTSTEAVKVGGYIIALLIYIFFMAAVPFLTALLTRDFIFVFASMICVFFASGDILLLFKLLKYIGSYVIDYESVYLFTVYKKVK